MSAWDDMDVFCKSTPLLPWQQIRYCHGPSGRLLQGNPKDNTHDQTPPNGPPQSHATPCRHREALPSFSSQAAWMWWGVTAVQGEKVVIGYHSGRLVRHFVALNSEANNNIGHRLPFQRKNILVLAPASIGFFLPIFRARGCFCRLNWHARPSSGL